MIYTKTPLGQSALLNRSRDLTPRQRAAFILFDGKRSLSTVLKATAGLGVVPADIECLVTQALIEAATPLKPEPVSGSTRGGNISGVGRSEQVQHCYLNAYLTATRLTSELGLRGFKLNLAVEAAMDLEKLRYIAPKLKQALSPEKYAEFEAALQLTD
jgi:hypothetical protein